MFTPSEVGAPAKFTEWRPGQLEAICAASAAPERVVVHAMSTGGGKSLTGVAHGLIEGVRTVYLTQTKALQAQLTKDFAEIGMVDLRGQNNYECIAAQDFGIDETIMVSEAPCQSGLFCPLRESGCLYYSRVKLAQNAQLVVTNYQMYMTICKYSDGLGKIDLLICDEAHEADKALADFLSVELDDREVQYLLNRQLPTLGNFDDWKGWCGSIGRNAQERIDQMTQELRTAKEAGQKLSGRHLRDTRNLKRLAKKLIEIEQAEGEWIFEWTGDKRIKFSPIWPAAYAERCLFRGVPKVILMSATVNHKTLNILGLKQGEYAFLEAPSTFPPENRPVYHVPTVWMNHSMSMADKRKMVMRIDQIIRARQDRKGIIHSVSYERANFIKQNSAFKSIMITHDSKHTRSAIEQFRNAEAPCYLVSPAISTGVDFPEDLAEVNIIPKMPYPDMSSPIMLARKKADPEYVDYLVAQQVTQMAGRTTRSEFDKSETFIVDDVWTVFKRKHADLFQGWFLEACKEVCTIPRPPAPLYRVA